MSFKWQFGCGCNLDQPESCYPQLLWRAIRLSDLKNKVVPNPALARTSLLIVRLDGPPCISIPGDTSLKVVSLKYGASETARTIEYIYADDSFLNSFGLNGFVSQTQITPAFIQHYYHPIFNINGRRTERPLENIVFEKFQDCSREAIPGSFLLPAFFVPNYREQAAWQKVEPQIERLQFAFENMERMWGNSMVMVVKCCNPPATHKDNLRPLRMVADIRTGIAEWNSSIDLTFKSPYKDDGWTISKFYLNSGALTYSGGFGLFVEEVMRCLSSRYEKAFGSDIYSSNHISTRFQYGNKSLPIVYDDFLIEDKDICCKVLFQDNSDKVKTGYVSYVSQDFSDRAHTVIKERYQSYSSCPNIVKWNYSTLDFRGLFYDIDYNIDEYSYKIYLKKDDTGVLYGLGKYVNSYGYLKTDNGLYSMGMFRNDPQYQSSGSVKHLALPDIFFTNKKIKFRMNLDKTFYNIYGHSLNGFPYMTDSYVENLQQMQKDYETKLSLILQSPVAIDDEKVFLTYKPKTGGLLHPQFEIVCQVNEDNATSGRPTYLTLSPNDSQYSYFNNGNLVIFYGMGSGAGVNVDYMNYAFKTYLENNGLGTPLYYFIFSHGLDLKQDFWANELTNKDLKENESFFVSVFCKGSFDVVQAQDITNDLYSRVYSYYNQFLDELQIRAPVKCQTSNILCVDLKQQFFDENGTKINLVESNPE